MLHIKGIEEINKKIEHYGIKVGETTSDNLLSLLSARCFGAYALAPVIVCNDTIIEKVSIQNPLCGIRGDNQMTLMRCCR